jgi:hypothetical protein
MPGLRIGIALLILAVSTAAQDVSIRQEGDSYRITGWAAGSTEPPGGWPSLFAVYAGEGDVPPMLGSYSVENGSLVFRPRYPPSPLVQVRAVFRPPDRPAITASFEPRTARPPATAFVEHVYPTRDLLPDNQLKMYVVFSAPMSRGEAWKRIHLLDDRGRKVDLAFLEIEQELWDQEQRRLTVLFDPGRIKRGLVPHNELGPALIEGREYTLLIEREWQDPQGAPLREEFRKKFRVGPADRTATDVKTWRLTPPQPGASAPLVVKFPEPMDWAMLYRAFAVSGPNGPVSGAISVASGETEWRFTPTVPWAAGDYRLTVDTSLEDLAGNKIGRVFDVDLDRFDRVSQNVIPKTESIPFRVSRQ